MKRAAVYLRVSTDQQTTDNQLRELNAVAARSGWQIVHVFSDNGVSGAKGRDKRPQFDAMLKGATRRELDVVMAWSVDRLGRSLPHLIELLGELQASGTDLYLHQQAVDTTTPAGRALFGMMGVFAEFERAIIQERVKAGLARAKAQGKKLGRPRIEIATQRKIISARKEGLGIRKIATTLRVGVGTVKRVLAAA